MTGVASSADPDTHALAWGAEIEWLERLIDHRFQTHFRPDETAPDLPEPPRHVPAQSALGNAIEKYGLSPQDRTVLALAITPNLRPQALDAFHVRNPNIERTFTEFGGHSGASDSPASGFLPTFETAAFLVAGNSLVARLKLERDFLDQGRLIRAKLIERPATDGNFFTTRLRPTAEALARLCHDRPHRPDLSTDFPARRLTTQLNWDDLVLTRAGRDEISEVLAWVRHGSELLKDPHFGRLLRPGYRALFSGPPGTGKTLTATLLGKETGRDVFCVDLSLVVSKWIGETEKNLAGLFDRAESAGWILFFDEADALFGKRSNVTDSHDRYANQEVSYILQRVEAFDGLVILASNLAGNIDDAFSRRFQAVVPFPMPGPAERKTLWDNALPATEQLCDDIDTDALARRYELSGGSIINVLLSASLSMRSRADHKIGLSDIERAVAREMWKEGRIGERAR